MSEFSSSLSDSDELPEISTLFPTRPQTDISKDDIVWAKYKKLYWPALVRNVFKKQKKISVWFTDDPGKTFKLYKKNVYRFYDWKMRVKIIEDVKEAGCIREHEGLTSHAAMYLDRKAQGYVDDPMKYFDQTYPFFLAEDLLKKDPNANVSGLKMPPLYITHREQNIRKSINVQKATSSTVESDIESVSSDSESDAKDERNEILSKVTQALSSLPERDKNTDNIVEFIKSGKANDYLKKVLSKCVPSKHRDMYEEEMKNNKQNPNQLTYTGPINDDKKLRELIFYLLPLYDSMTSTRRSKRYPTRKCRVRDYSNIGKKNQGAQYVASVLLPEAIIYAMSDIYNVSIEKAWQLFVEKSKSELNCIEDVLSSFEPGATTSDSKTIKQKLTSQDENNIEICSPSKKLCDGKLKGKNSGH